MADIQRSVDLGRVVNKLASQLADKDQRIAILEVGLEDAVAQTSEYHKKVEALELENRELREKVQVLEAEPEEAEPAGVKKSR